MNTYIAIDLETTGLYPSRDRIIEIGAIKIKDGHVVDEFSSFVNPQMRVPERIRELTGITSEMAMSGPVIEEIMPRLIEFCEDYSLLGHSIMFDYSFLKHKSVNMGVEFERSGIDTLAIARQKLADLESRRLCALCEHYKIERNQIHRATEDALAAHLVYQKLKEEFGEASSTIFEARPLIYKVKKQGPITNRQKDYLNDLLKYHKMEIDVALDSLTKNEASRLIDSIILKKGKMWRSNDEKQQ